MYSENERIPYCYHGITKSNERHETYIGIASLNKPNLETMADASKKQSVLSQSKHSSQHPSSAWASTTEAHDDTTQRSLPLALKLLFALNGFSLAFPVTALLYIVNTRVEMSLALLPTYGAVAFLPNSLRPLYAYLSQTRFRDRLIAFLLCLSFASTLLTALIPKHGVTLCFVAAFLRGVASSWPEFLLGLTLVDQARTCTDFDQACAVFQSQAATTRNIGSMTASVGALLLLSGQDSLHPATMDILLFVSAGSNLIGSGIALFYQVGRQPIFHSETSNVELVNYQSIPYEDASSCDTSLTSEADTDDVPTVCFWRNGTSHNLRLVVLLQITVILFALRQPLESWLSLFAWQGITAASVLALIFSFTAAVWTTGQLQHSQKVGLFLILRHMIPEVTSLMIAYLYDIFATTPYLLQLLSITDVATATIATWSYGKFWSKFSSDKTLPLVIVGTTLVAAITSLSQIWLVRILPTLAETPLVQFGVVVIVRALVSWTGEWNFMPDVVLATTAVKHASKTAAAVVLTNEQDREIPAGNESIEQIEEIESPEDRQAINVQYGTLISCLDFGDQLGALVLAALISAFDVTRENNWDHLDDLTQLCCVLGVCSTLFVLILR